MKVYRAGWSRYQTFVNQFKIASTPATLEKVTLFIAYLGSQGLAVSMIEVYLAGLRYFRIQANPTCMTPSLHSPYINLIIKHIKRINSAKEPTRVRLPITATLIGRIKGLLSADPHQWDRESDGVGSMLHQFLWLPVLCRVRHSRQHVFQPEGSSKHIQLGVCPLRHSST